MNSQDTYFKLTINGVFNEDLLVYLIILRHNILYMNIHLTRQGQGQPLVFFHGWGFDSTIWNSLKFSLHQQYEIILVDLPGFGLSKLQDWNEFKANLLTLLPEQFSVIGWSLGGLYATKLAIEEPRKVQHLVNIASSPRFIIDEIWPGVPPEILSNFHAKLSLDKESVLKDFLALQVSKQLSSIQLGSIPSEEGLSLGLTVLETWDLRKYLDTIQLPTCYMFGKLDRITPVKTLVALQQKYPQFHYILFEKAAHMPFLSHQHLFIEELLRFIK